MQQQDFVSETTAKAQWSLYVPPSGHYMYRTVVTICTASLTFNNSTFCPHTVYLCRVLILVVDHVVFGHVVVRVATY